MIGVLIEQELGCMHQDTAQREDFMAQEDTVLYIMAAALEN